jgi:hypothetical protein
MRGRRLFSGRNEWKGDVDGHHELVDGHRELDILAGGTCAGRASVSSVVCFWRIRWQPVCLVLRRAPGMLTSADVC